MILQRGISSNWAVLRNTSWHCANKTIIQTRNSTQTSAERPFLPLENGIKSHRTRQFTQAMMSPISNWKLPNGA